MGSEPTDNSQIWVLNLKISWIFMLLLRKPMFFIYFYIVKEIPRNPENLKNLSFVRRYWISWFCLLRQCFSYFLLKMQCRFATLRKRRFHCPCKWKRRKVRVGKAAFRVKRIRVLICPAQYNARKATSRKACFCKAAKVVKTTFSLALPMKTQRAQVR